MNKLEYLLHSVERKYYVQRLWLLTMHSVWTRDTWPSDSPYLTMQGNDLVMPDGTVINDYVPGQPLYGVNEMVTLETGTFSPSFMPTTIETTYGALLVNLLMVWYPYEGQVEYRNKQSLLTPKSLNKLAADRFRADPSTIENHKRFEAASNMWPALSQIAVPSATRKSILPNKAIWKRRDELVKKHEHELTNPAVIAKIQKELADMDRAALADDPSSGFNIKGKSYDVTRLQMYGMYGAEPDFVDPTKLHVITKSLSEEWGPEDMQVMINTSRAGIHSRGALTALGGAKAKDTMRFFQTAKKTELDCGDTIGMTVKVAPFMRDILVGRNIVGGSAIKDSDFEGLIGKTVKIRTPARCRVTNSGYCSKCLGTKVDQSEIGLGAMASTATSTFLDVFMAAAHATAIKTTRYDYKTAIR